MGEQRAELASFSPERGLTPGQLLASSPRRGSMGAIHRSFTPTDHSPPGGSRSNSAFKRNVLRMQLHRSHLSKNE